MTERARAAGRVLVVVAVLPEARAIAGAVGAEPGVAERLHVSWDPVRLGDSLDLLVAGVGKSNACGATARALTLNRYRFALSMGVCGSLPGDGERPVPELGQSICATESVFADEGVVTPDGFEDLATMGFAPDDGVDGPGSVRIACDRPFVRKAERHVDHVGPIATVSLCSGTDEHARFISSTSGCVCEAMEGAGVGLAVRRLGGGRVGFGEVRVVSNSTGDRVGQRWDLAGALDRLGAVSSRLLRSA